MNKITIEYGSDDKEFLEVHQFLCIVGGSSLLAPIDPNDSISEIMRVASEGACIIARDHEGHLVGSLGLIRVPWWYNTKQHFLTNRWFSVWPQLKHAGVGVRLEAEAAAIGLNAGLPVVITSHVKRRKAASPTEPSFMRDHVAVSEHQE